MPWGGQGLGELMGRKCRRRVKVYGERGVPRTKDRRGRGEGAGVPSEGGGGGARGKNLSLR